MSLTPVPNYKDRDQETADSGLNVAEVRKEREGEEMINSNFYLCLIYSSVSLRLAEMPTLEEVITANSWGHLDGSEVTVEAAEDH